MSAGLQLLIGAVVLLVIGWVLLHLIAGPDPPARPPAAPRRDPRLDESLFRARAWKHAVLPRLGNYNRPADIDLVDDALLPPPRQIEGVNGE